MKKLATVVITMIFGLFLATSGYAKEEMDSKSGSSQVTITNPMPHTMNVKADWGNGDQDLGEVEAKETKTFDVDASAGSEVKLTATDEKKTHSRSGTVKLSADNPATWTIE